MAIRIRADQLQLGDVLARSVDRGPMSVKEITVLTNPVFRTKEIKIRGPLNIIEKHHADAMVTILNNRVVRQS